MFHQRRTRLGLVEYLCHPSCQSPTSLHPRGAERLFPWQMVWICWIAQRWYQFESIRHLNDECQKSNHQELWRTERSQVFQFFGCIFFFRSWMFWGCWSIQLSWRLDFSVPLRSTDRLRSPRLSCKNHSYLCHHRWERLVSWRRSDGLDCLPCYACPAKLKRTASPERNVA